MSRLKSSDLIGAIRRGVPSLRPRRQTRSGSRTLHINDEDLLADPEIALQMHFLEQLAGEGVVRGAVTKASGCLPGLANLVREWT